MASDRRNSVVHGFGTGRVAAVPNIPPPDEQIRELPAKARVDSQCTAGPGSFDIELRGAASADSRAAFGMRRSNAFWSQSKDIAACLIAAEKYK